jgi:hypothetical protein
VSSHPVSNLAGFEFEIVPKDDSILHLTIEEERDLNLTQEEKRYFSYLFANLTQDNSPGVKGDLIVKFMDRSGLPSKILGEMWQIVDTENRGQLNSVEFCKFLRLIGHFQVGAGPLNELTLIREFFFFGAVVILNATNRYLASRVPYLEGIDMRCAPAPYTMHASEIDRELHIIPTKKQFTEFAALFEMFLPHNGVTLGRMALSSKMFSS